MLQLIEYNGYAITARVGTAETKDGSSWIALGDIDYALGSVYNRIKADFLALTNSGKVTAFKV